jgi:uncharacterized protein YegP (UPF0339 family)
MSGWFELHRGSNDQFYIVRQAGKAKDTRTSEHYTTRASAENGIASVQKNSPDDAHYERKVAKDGRHYFNLKAVNHQVIGSSQMYASPESCEKGIASVKVNGPSDAVKDKTVAA